MKKNFDDLLIENNLKEKMHEEMKSLKDLLDKPKEEKKFNSLTENELFSTRALWKVFNRKTATKSIINGLQAEAFLSLQENTRKEIVEHETDCFLSDHRFVEFYKFI